MSQFSTPSNKNQFSQDSNDQRNEVVHFKDLKWDCLSCNGGFLKVFGTVTGYDTDSGKDIRDPLYVSCSNKVPEGEMAPEGGETCTQKMMFSKFSSTCSYCLKKIAVRQFIALVPNSNKKWVHGYCLNNKPSITPTPESPLQNGQELCLRCGGEFSKAEDKQAVPARYKLQAGRIHKECIPKKELSKRKYDGI